jgi:hypothetical protein
MNIKDYDEINLKLRCSKSIISGYSYSYSSLNVTIDNKSKLKKRLNGLNGKNCYSPISIRGFCIHNVKSNTPENTMFLLIVTESLLRVCYNFKRIKGYLNYIKRNFVPDKLSIVYNYSGRDE